MTDPTLPPHFSPLLASLAPEQRPAPAPDCSACPAGNWYRTLSPSTDATGKTKQIATLKCYCELMYRDVYVPGSLIRGCDLRTNLLHQYANKPNQT